MIDVAGVRQFYPFWGGREHDPSCHGFMNWGFGDLGLVSIFAGLLQVENYAMYKHFRVLWSGHRISLLYAVTPRLTIVSSMHGLSHFNFTRMHVYHISASTRGKFPQMFQFFHARHHPLILAAHRDHYEIIKILLERGDRIEKPHDVQCGCAQCVVQSSEDSLNHSRSRINAYRALASPSLIALSSRDPILTAFKLSWELRLLSRLENELKVEYEQLAKQCQDFAVDLLDQTRGSKELEVLLNYDSDGLVSESMNSTVVKGDMSLARLKLAIKYKQKKVRSMVRSVAYLGGIGPCSSFGHFLNIGKKNWKTWFAPLCKHYWPDKICPLLMKSQIRDWVRCIMHTQGGAENVRGWYTKN